MSSEIAIKVDSVSKAFKLPHEKQSSVKGIVLNAFSGRRTFEHQQVLENVSFEIKKGEFFGIVGRNGSGKSTLLKLIAQIYEPNKGRVHINGSLTPFIELGVGFNHELTGRENVFLNGALLGFSRKEMLAKYQSIVDFSELERFMDQKLKNYSSGMQVRLAFAIAIQAESDILLLDEVLAVGDYAFQQKCYEYFKYLKSAGKTVVLVSHDANALQMFCTHGVLIEDGKILHKGTIGEVLKTYSKQTIKRQEAEQQLSNNQPSRQVEGGELVKLHDVFTEHQGRRRRTFMPYENITIVYEIEPTKNLDDPVFGLVIQDATGGPPLFATNTLDSNTKTGVVRGGEKVQVRFDIKNVFNDSKLYISGAIANKDRSQVYIRFYNATSFSSVGWGNTARGSVYLPHQVKVG